MKREHIFPTLLVAVIGGVMVFGVWVDMHRASQVQAQPARVVPEHVIRARSYYISLHDARGKVMQKWTGDTVRFDNGFVTFRGWDNKLYRVSGTIICESVREGAE